jgi:hypothetical protein
MCTDRKSQNSAFRNTLGNSLRRSQLFYGCPCVKLGRMLTPLAVILVYTGQFLTLMGRKILGFSETNAKRKYLGLIGV